jgi:hypothetical protein
MVDLVGASLIVDLPEAEAHEGHLITAVELDGWGSHCEYLDSNRIESNLTLKRIRKLVKEALTGNRLQEDAGLTGKKSGS